VGGGNDGDRTFTKATSFGAFRLGAEYFAPQLKVDIRSRLKDKIMFAAIPKYPLERPYANGGARLTPMTSMSGWFHQNAERVLGL